jgi:hypothetical protein
VLESIAAIGDDDEHRTAGSRDQEREQLWQAVGGEGEEDDEGEDRGGDAAAGESEEEGQRQRRQGGRGEAPRKRRPGTGRELKQQRQADRHQRSEPVPVVERV